MGVGLSEFEEPLQRWRFEVLDLIAGDIAHNVAAPLTALMVEAQRQPVLNLHLARAYLTASDPAFVERTWQTVSWRRSISIPCGGPSRKDSFSMWSKITPPTPPITG